MGFFADFLYLSGQPIAYLACPCLEERGSRASLLPLRSNSLTFLKTKNNVHYFLLLFYDLNGSATAYTPVVIGYSNESGTVSTQSVHGTVTLTGLGYIHGDNLFMFLFLFKQTICEICGKISLSTFHKKAKNK
jgi:hypothetical protein